MDGLAHGVVAAEAEAHVGDPARHLGVRQVFPDPARRVDEVDRVVVVLVDAGGDREHVRVEDQVFRRKADAVQQQVVAAARDLRLALERVRLPLLVERHDDDGCAVAAHQPRLAQELGLAFLERNRIDDSLALDALESRLDHVPFRRVDHHRHARDVGFGGDEVQVFHHRRLGIEHRLVHVDVDDLRAAGDLRARDFHGARVVAGEDQLGERPRTGDVGAFADVDEQRVVADREAAPGRTGASRGTWSAVGGDDRRDGQWHFRATRSVARARGQATASAAASDRHCRGGSDFTASAMARMCAGVVPQQPPTMFTNPLCAKSCEHARGLRRRFVVAGVGHRIGQAGIRIARDERIGDARDFLDVRAASAPRRARN